MTDNYSIFGQEPGFVPQQPQPYVRDNNSAAALCQRDHSSRASTGSASIVRSRNISRNRTNQPQPVVADNGSVDRLPSFITGGAQPQVNGSPDGYEGNDGGERPSAATAFRAVAAGRTARVRTTSARPPRRAKTFNPGNE